MPLILKIISPTMLPSGQLPEFSFDELGGSIGRKPNNDFILIDPERFISSQHACIIFEAGKFLISDTSTNGVFINNAKQPVGTGQTAELNDGDKISIGEFQLEATLKTQSASTDDSWPELNPNIVPAATPSLSEGFSHNAAHSADIFDFSEPLAGADNNSNLNSMDPLALLANNKSDRDTQGGADNTASENFLDNLVPSSDDHFFSNNELNNAGLNSNSNNDFFSSVSDNPHENIPEPLPINEPFTPPSAIPDNWDIMADEHPEASATLSPAFTNDQPATASTLNSGSSSTLNSNTTDSFDDLFGNTAFENTTPIIPEDFSDALIDTSTTNNNIAEDDIFASLSVTSVPITTSPNPAPTQKNAQPIASTPDILDALNFDSAPDSAPVVAPVTAPVMTPAPSQPSSTQSPNQLSSQFSNQSPSQNPGQTSIQASASLPTSNRELVDAFIKGAGLDPATITTDNPVELLTKFGQLTRISTEGLMMALRARATIKSSFRVNKTIIAPVENNPLKFSVTSEDALNIMFTDGKTGYMPATEAFSEGFKDLQTHQMAMMAGMQAIIKEISEQFSPATLERNFEQQKPSGRSLLGNKKAKNWDMYQEYYSKMKDTLKDDFQNVYGEEFARAYENQIRKLM